jgi:hypothetical protein
MPLKLRTRKTLFAAVAAAALSSMAAPGAQAASTGETIGGVASGTIALTAGSGAVFSGFSPGTTATATGALTATTTNPSWTLSVQDNGAGAGHMVSGTPGLCSGSDSQVTNSLEVAVTAPLALGGFQSAGAKTISGSPVTVASASAQLLAANVLTTNYTQVIPSSQVMLAGCPYNLTATYTLQ